MADSSGVGRQAARDAVLRLATADPELIVRVIENTVDQAVAAESEKAA